MAKNKTQPTQTDPRAFIAAVEDEQKRTDAEWLLEAMSSATGHSAVMWGPSIIGFGTYHYVYASGREGDWPEIGFSPRKANLSIYLMCGVERNPELLAKLGKYRTGKSCLYIKRLSDVDKDVLTALIEDAVVRVRNNDVKY